MHTISPTLPLLILLHRFYMLMLYYIPRNYTQLGFITFVVISCEEVGQC